MLRRFLAGGSFALAMLAFNVHAENVTPTWGSDQVRGARTVTPAPAISFSYQRIISEKGLADEADAGHVTLAPDFTAVTAADASTIDDFALCRTLTWYAGKDIVDNDSCYALPAFRSVELINRRGLNALLANLAKSDKTKAGPEMLDLYWAEQELAVQESPSSPLTPTQTATQMEWRLKDQVVVRASLSGAPFTAAERHAVERYFARHLDLHPQVRTAVLNAGRLPDTIVIERRAAGRATTETLHFSNLTRQPAAYPLPPHLKSSLIDRAAGATPEAAGLRQTLAAIDGTAKPAKTSFDDLVARMQAAGDAQLMPEAAMAFFQLTQQYGGVLQAGTPELTKLRAHGATLQIIFASPDVQPFMQASDIAGGNASPAAAEAAARYLSTTTTFNGVPFGTFRLVTFANLVRTADGAGKWDKAIYAAMPSLADCYWTHIAAYPWAANAYKDLGDSYYAGFEVAQAWQAWDLGRAADPNWKLSVMKSIADYEDRLRQRAPESF